MRYNFCTYFDHRYLSKGLALYDSLRRHCPSFQLWVLCLDDECYEALSQLKLPSIRPIALSQFEEGDEDLLRAKSNRSLVEYYFTCTPSLCWFIFNNYPEVDLLTYLDADLYFFSDVSPVFHEIKNSSVAIIEHRFHPALQSLNMYGIYNVGWVSFRRDEDGLECVRWWREKCNEWCYDRLEDERYADQKYLDDWPSRFNNVTVIKHKGANLAPWNLKNYEIEYRKSKVLVDGQPLIFFHFHGIKKIGRWVFNCGLAKYDSRLTEAVVRRVYLPYLSALARTARRVAPHVTNASQADSVRFAPAEAPPRRSLSLGRIISTFSYLRYVRTGLAEGQYVVEGPFSNLIMSFTRR